MSKPEVERLAQNLKAHQWCPFCAAPFDSCEGERAACPKCKATGFERAIANERINAKVRARKAKEA